MDDPAKKPEEKKGFFLRDPEDSDEIQLPGKDKNPTKNNPNRPRAARKGSKSGRSRSKTSGNKSISRFVDEENRSGDEARGQGQYEELSQSQKSKEEDDDLSSKVPSSSKTTLGKTPLSKDDAGLMENISPENIDSSDERSTFEEIESQGFHDDQQLEEEIQEAIEKEKSISAIAKNIQISVENGKATLVGIVPSEHEKMTIGDKAAAFVGFGKVINELEVGES